MEIRSATTVDLPDLDWMEDWYRPSPEDISAAQCFLAIADSEILGVLCFDHAFFHKPFIKTIVVRKSARRRGAASALIREVEKRNPGKKIFISTGLTNVAMQAVLHQLNYKQTGVIENLGPEPELFYFKLCPKID